MSNESGASVQRASPRIKYHRTTKRPGLRNSSVLKKKKQFQPDGKPKKVKGKKTTRMQLV